jgi:hypothetical protein
VADCIAEFQGKTERDIQIEGLRHALKKMPPYAQERARRLLAELTGLISTDGQSKAVDEPRAEDSKAEAPKIGESNSESRVPAGATALVDRDGVIKGYRSADGQYVQLADVEVTR